MLEVQNRYDEFFEIEMDGWCYGIQHYPGEMHPTLVHAVIRELRPPFLGAVKNFHVFDVLALSKKISRAAKYLIHEKEVAFAVLAHLPTPQGLNEDEQFILAQIIDQVEREYGGALERLKKKWAYEAEQAKKQAA